MSDTDEVRIAKIRVTRPLEIRWTCPDPVCKAINIELRYSAPGDIKVQCRGCGQTFFGERDCP